MDATSLSLLERLHGASGDRDWRQLVELYTPLIRGWLLHHAAISAADVDDLTQEVLTTLVREMPSFQHSGRTGAFRHWLRQIAVNRLRHFLRQRQSHAVASGDTAVFNVLDQLADDGSALSRVWDAEHDRHVMRVMLRRLEGSFQPSTWQAFCRTALDGADAATVAAELGLTVKAVVVAKSRVLKRLRDESAGLLKPV